MKPRAVVVGAFLLVLVGCGDETAGSAPGNNGPGLTASCGDVEFGAPPADWSEFPSFSDRMDEIDLEAIAPEGEMFDDHEWFVAEESGDHLVLFGAPGKDGPPGSPPEGPQYAYAALERHGDGWLPGGWGGCGIEVAAPGWVNARFVLDPDVEPDPASAVVSVLAWEINCASGQTPSGRDIKPVVVDADAETVSVVVLVEPVTGNATCQGNPSFPLEIDLGEPLGDRAIVDASVDPPLDRPWPPTASSRNSMGLVE